MKKLHSIVKALAIVFAACLMADSVRADVPAAPEGLRRRTYETDFVVRLWWEPTPGADSYNIYRADETNGLFELAAIALTDPAFADVDALFQHNYHYFISGVNAEGESAPSGEVFARPDYGGVVTFGWNYYWFITRTSAAPNWSISSVAGAETLFQWGTSTNYDNFIENTNYIGGGYFVLSNLSPETVYFLQLTATDTNGNAIVAPTSLTTLASNRPPTAIATNITASEDVTKYVQLSGTDQEGATLAYSVASAPTNGTVTINGGGYATYRSNTNASGADSFSFRVFDGEDYSAPATVLVSITPVNDAPVAFPQSVATAYNTPKLIVLSSFDVEGSAMTYSVFGAPAHGTLTGTASNAVIYTPTTAYSGADSFGFRAHDGQLFSAAATISVTVSNATSVPAQPTNLTTGQVTRTSIVLSWNDNANNEDRYIIERSVNNPNVFTTVAVSPGPNYTGSVVMTNLPLSPNTLYFYRIRATNILGTSAYSNTNSARTLP
jgi:hypothetical protein